MSLMPAPISELVLHFDPAAARGRLSRRAGQLRSRLFSLGITIVILGLLYLWQRDQIRDSGFGWAYAVVLGISVGWVIGFLIAYLVARSAVRNLPQGIAMQIGPRGVVVAGLGVGWPEVASLGVVRSGPARVPHLRLTTTTGAQASVRMDQLGVLPAQLDTAARAFSGARHGVDLTALDN